MYPLVSVAGLAEHTDDAFRRALVAGALAHDLNPDFVAACMAFETAATFSPSKRSGDRPGACVGLIQFCNCRAYFPDAGSEAEARDMMAALSPVAQLAYVWEHFRRTGTKPVTLVDHYLAIFSPRAVGKPAGAVVYSAAEDAARGVSWYEQNKGLDANHDKVITVAEATAPVSRIYAAGLARPPLVVAGGGLVEKVLPYAILLLATGGAVYLHWR